MTIEGLTMLLRITGAGSFPGETAAARSGSVASAHRGGRLHDNDPPSLMAKAWVNDVSTRNR
jgi:hypothetical protein